MKNLLSLIVFALAFDATAATPEARCGCYAPGELGVPAITLACDGKIKGTFGLWSACEEKMGILEQSLRNPFNGECSCVPLPGNYPGVLLFREATVWGESIKRKVALHAFPLAEASMKECANLKTSLEELGVCEVK